MSLLYRNLCDLSEARQHQIDAERRRARTLEYEWNTDDMDGVICDLHYSPAEAPSMDSPGCESTCELASAMFEGRDIADSLTAEQVEHIEREALIEYEESMR
jgi:hypothetical protein